MNVAQRIGRYLQRLCEADLASAREEGRPLTKEGWRARQAEKIKKDNGESVSADTFENWYYGDIAPHPDKLDQLFNLYGAAFRNEAFPCDDDGGSYQDGRRDEREEMMTWLQERNEGR